MTKEFNGKKLKKIITIIVLVLVIVLVLIGLRGCAGARRAKNASSETVFGTVTTGTIQNIITGTGIVEPKERYDITALVTGDIISSPYEEGDAVKDGDVLYTIDDEDIQISISKTKNAISVSQMSYDSLKDDVANLTITAPSNGKITGLTLITGNNVMADSTVCQLTDTNTLEVNLPFSKAQIDKIGVGDSVTLVSADYMSSFYGTVTYVGNSAYAGASGGVFYDVEITCTNPGAIPEGTKVVGTVHTAYGDVESPSEGVVGYPTSVPVKAKTSGEVVTLKVKEGQYVTAGTVIAILENDTLQTQLKQAEISLENSRYDLDSMLKNLENYNITSPIDGTVLTKNYKAGDTIGNGQNSAVLMSVVDMSAVKFVISADELDVGKISVGQKVSVTADAIDGKTFEGFVSNVSGDGSAANGVTTYDVTIQIDEPGELKLGMNVEASIVVEESVNTLIAPVSGVIETINGTFAIVKDEHSEEDDKTDDAQVPRLVSDMVVDGTKAVRVEAGINDEDNIEILSGLKEGDEILITNSGNGTITSTIGMQGGPGGMSGMGGPMNGGAPSGNMSGAR